MFWRIHEYRTLLPVLCGLVFIAVWNNTIFWTFCPRQGASSHHCLTGKSASPSRLNANSRTMSNEYHRDMEMSEMDEEEVSCDGSTTSETKTGNLSLADPPAFDPLRANTIKGSQGSCSHCIMHSQSDANSPGPTVLNNSASQASHGIVAAACNNVWASVASAATFVDIHDHGPPGLNSSRYILNSSFRI